MSDTITYEATAVRAGFSPGAYGPWAVTIYCENIVPPFPDYKDGFGFQLDNTGVITLNGAAVTLRELVVALCENVEPRSIKARIVWNEHSYASVQEAHFTSSKCEHRSVS